ncbi:transcription regulator [Halococcus morrhuae DSM 1307]|uniref:Transcription regulator n=1 Tax=Halococcus morrhuae DSM 1307 TaxID=931277 RepID=M0MNR9_HALMO|nr:IclR family transcriptional regulator [Halococcus morrhuae]EMA47311.1 transcription regulator [Halococcus morrhuae DSM 1307]
MPDKDGIKAVRTTFRIIEELRCTERKMGVSALADALDLPVSTVHSHLSTLVEAEYLVQCDGTYDLGYRFLEVGGHRRHRTRLFEYAKPKVDQLATEFGDEVSLCVADRDLGAHIYISRGEEAIRTDTFTGIRLPLYATATGKAILAQLSPEHLEAILGEIELISLGPNTITSEDDLHNDLDRIRHDGTAYDRQERLEGIHGVAAPIPRPEGPSAAIGVTGPISRMMGERFERDIPERIRNIAETIRIKLRYS